MPLAAGTSLMIRTTGEQGVGIEYNIQDNEAAALGRMLPPNLTGTGGFIPCPHDAPLLEGAKLQYPPFTRMRPISRKSTRTK